MRIADEDALPLDSAFDWEGVSGQDIKGHSFPKYDSSAPNAAAQGRDLVEVVSDEIASDDDGSLAAWLAGFVTEKGSASALTIVTDGDAVSVDNGWWLLTSSGRRPLLAWVEGAPLVLGDKSDAPVLEKKVEEDGEWGDSAIYGSGRTLNYRLTLTVPESYEGYKTYRLAFHDKWDERLSLVEDSMAIELIHDGERIDITDLFVFQTAATSFVAEVADLHRTVAVPGDMIVLTYRMTADSLSASGSVGLENSAWATYPRFDGEGETPKDKNKVYSFQVEVEKVSADNGAPLADAVFALKDPQGAWLAADGSFGDERDRATFTTGDHGVTEHVPLLATGTYVLVEIEAPKGYLLPEDPETIFTISADHSFENIEMTIDAEETAKVERVSADRGSFTLIVADEPEPSTPVPPDKPSGWLPQTWDSMAPWQRVACIAAVIGMAALASAAMLRWHRELVEGNK